MSPNIKLCYTLPANYYYNIDSNKHNIIEVVLIFFDEKVGAPGGSCNLTMSD